MPSGQGTRRDAAVRELVRRCRETGLKVTPQRVLVYRTLMASDGHPGPEEIYEQARKQMPFLSLATVYKALDTLERLGLATRVWSRGETRRYDGNREQHHHLICTRCGRMVDHHDEIFDNLHLTRPASGFRAEQIAVQVLGVCRDCDEDAPRGARRR